MKSSVNAIIFSKDKNQILIIERRDVSVWVLPGGGVEKGETPEEAVLREVEEETGCRIAIRRKSGLYYPINLLATTTHVFVCNVIEGIPKVGAETRNVGFFSLEELPRNFFHIHKDFLSDALKNQRSTVEKYLTQVTYGRFIKYFISHPLRVMQFILSKLGLPFNS